MRLYDYLNEEEEENNKPLFDMTEEDKIEKIKKDPIWFIESYCKIDGDKPFKMFEYQKEFVKKVMEHKYLIVNKSRQMGVSQIAGAFCLWYSMTKPKKETIIISLNTTEAEYFIDRRIWDVYDELPKFIKMRIKIKHSENEIKFENGSRIEAMANTKKALRGRSPSMVVVDEMAFQNQAKAMITSAMPALQLGEHLILISTPNGTQEPGEFFYKTWQKAKEGNSDFYPLKINWYENPMYNPDAPKEVDWQKNKWAMSQYRNYTDADSFKQEILGEFIDIRNDISAGVTSQGGQEQEKKPVYNMPEYLKDYWRKYIRE